MQKQEGKYTVKKGDTAFSISKKYGIELGDLLSNNESIKQSSNIKEGQVLNVPIKQNPETRNSSTAQSNIEKAMKSKTSDKEKGLAETLK